MILQILVDPGRWIKIRNGDMILVELLLLNSARGRWIGTRFSGLVAIDAWYAFPLPRPDPPTESHADLHHNWAFRSNYPEETSSSHNSCIGCSTAGTAEQTHVEYVLSLSYSQKHDCSTGMWEPSHLHINVCMHFSLLSCRCPVIWNACCLCWWGFSRFPFSRKMSFGKWSGGNNYEGVLMLHNYA